MENTPHGKDEGGQGEDALMEHLEKKYGRLPDGCWKHMSLFGGGPRTLDRVCWYRQEGEKPYWLFVSFGFSELDEKVSDNPELSGTGFELSFRELRGSEEQPHEWPNRMMNNYAAYVFTEWNAFKPYDYMEMPLDMPEETLFPGSLFVPDAELGTVETPNGSVTYLQVVPLLPAELEELKRKNNPDDQDAYMEAAKKIEAAIAAKQTGLFITDLTRT